MEPQPPLYLKPINSSEAKIEITYSVNGDTAIFASGRRGSISSPGASYNFDILMAHKVKESGKLQFIWDRALIRLWAQTSIRLPGSWSRVALMMATSSISRDTSLAISRPVTYM